MLAPSRRTLAAVAAGAGLLATVGCGGAAQPNLSRQHPATELNHAIDNLGDGSQLTTDLHVDASAAALQRVFPDLKPDQAALLSDSHLVFQIRSQGDKDLRAYQQNVNDLPDFKIEMTTAKGSVFELREVEHTFYVKADSGLLATALGHPVSIGALGSGQWVEVDAPALEEHGQPIGDVTQTPKPLSGPAEFLPTLRDWVDKHVTVDRKLADDPNGDKLQLRVNAKDLVDELVSEATDALPAISSTVGPLLRAMAPDAPDKDMTVYAIVDRQELSQLYVWLDQFQPGRHSPTVQLPGKDPRLVLGIDTSVKSIEKPDQVASKMPLEQAVTMLQSAWSST